MSYIRHLIEKALRHGMPVGVPHRYSMAQGKNDTQTTLVVERVRRAVHATQLSPQVSIRSSRAGSIWKQCMEGIGRGRRRGPAHHLVGECWG